jgi:hypothetical protein
MTVHYILYLKKDSSFYLASLWVQKILVAHSGTCDQILFPA